ncbi:hypothetical protein [Candidatus Mycoplasma haematohominis]|uniref:Uncharacterized protein n=1 Tax=Candidatus Mycoplasma haematohominis TaxID=1494318 RepID=A0A478FU15_9MOLU|nr:hypothetical protein [Candidatus Mycoplasma haemohominis]GCE63595.1 hypothetical protein MHSWG343_05920 [Candidatus Mycoplasma haemohominis]
MKLKTDEKFYNSDWISSVFYGYMNFFQINTKLVSQTDLKKHEQLFLSRVFLKVAVGFLIYGFFITGLIPIVYKELGLDSGIITAICFLVPTAICGLIARMIDQIEIKKKVYCLIYFVFVFLTYTFSILGLAACFLDFSFVKKLDFDVAIFQTSLLFTAVFIVGFLIYLIPAIVGFFISRKTAISLKKFISLASTTTTLVLVMFAAFLVVCFKVIFKKADPDFIILITTFISVKTVLFLASTVKNTFRMKKTMKNIDYKNLEELRLWEFSFVTRNLDNIFTLIFDALSFLLIWVFDLFYD